MNEKRNPSRRSLFGLNAVNFFLAELVAVIGPFLAVFLKENQWSYTMIGVATAIGGVGTLLTQTPAGIICDIVKKRRLLLGGMSLLLGACFGVLPLVIKSIWLVNILLFLTGIANAFFVPLLATLALSLVGQDKLAQQMGQNQSWNHAGNIISALLTLLIVETVGIKYVFYIMSLASVFASLCLLLIKDRELKSETDEKKEPPLKRAKHVFVDLKKALQTPETRTLLLSVLFFHLANTPALPVLDLYLKQLGSSDDKVAWTVLIGQIAMVPTAYLAGRFAESRGRKPVFAIALLVLPVRLLLYTLTKSPDLLLAIQLLDGVAAGIYGVAIALMCSDLTEGSGGFNGLIGLAQTALALGGVLGPLCQGIVTQKLGFKPTFLILAGVGAIGALVFLTKMKETKKQS